MRPRRELITVAGLIAAAAAASGAMALAATVPAPSKTVRLSDPQSDVDGPLDMQRASLSLPSDGRLRAVVTLAAKIKPGTLLAATGPPGSICLKVWTDATADPSATRADRLVCATSRTKDELRASVLDQSKPGLPTHAADASVTLNKSGRSLVLRVSQSALGRPALIRFAVESTRPGCERVSCADELPDGGAVRRFRLHATP